MESTGTNPDTAPIDAVAPADAAASVADAAATTVDASVGTVADAAAPTETKLVIEPLLEQDADKFIVMEGRRLRNMLVRFYFDHMDDVIESSGMTCGQMLDLFLAEVGTPAEVAETAKGTLVENPLVVSAKRLKYLAEMSMEGTWGDQIMLLAFSEIFKQPVHVYQIQRGETPWSRMPKIFMMTSFGVSYDKDPMPVFYHGNHYSALLPQRDTVLGGGTSTESARDGESRLGVDFHLLNVPGDGNCLFSSLRLAMEIHETRIQMEARPELFNVSSIERIIGRHVKSQ